MRQTAPVFAALLFLCCQLTAAQVPYPYEVVVGRQGIDVYSGPSKEFYVTERLPRGRRVQVYGQEKGGWLAIRPPSDSFSWVRAADLQIADDDPHIAKVVRDDVICRVGSNVDRANNDVSQVRLRAGERVEVLDRVEIPTRRGGRIVSESWCRISPPAGEFRYVIGRALQPPTANSSLTPHPLAGLFQLVQPVLAPLRTGTSRQPTPAVAPPQAVVAAENSPNAAEENLTPTSVVTRPEPSSATSEQQGEVKVATTTTNPPREPRIAIPKEPGPKPPAERRVSNAERSGADALADSPQDTVSDGWKAKDTDPRRGDSVVEKTPAAASEPDQEKTGLSWAGSDKPAVTEVKDLDAIQLAVSAMATQEADKWQIAPLRQQLASFRNTKPSREELQQAAAIEKRLDEFAALQSRFTSTTSVASQLQPLAAQTSDPPAGLTADDIRYDGSGWLVPVHSTKRVAPPYALLDAEGNVIQYVSPVPGFNLHRYVRKQVGVFGQRGYIPSLKKQHVTAQRIVELDRHFR